MSKGTEDCVKAGAAALVFTYAAQRWPKVGGPLFIIIIVHMLFTGMSRGYIKLPRRA